MAIAFHDRKLVSLKDPTAPVAVSADGGLLREQGDMRKGIGKRHVKGVVLCGGRSQRFGSPKAGHAVDGITFLDRAMEAMRAHVGTLCLGIGDASPSGWPSVELVRDRITNIGPLGGIHAVMEGLDVEWLLVLAVDMPFITSDSLAKLVDAADHDLQAVVARGSEGRVHPLCALYHRSVLDPIRQAIEAREFAVKDVLSRLEKVQYVTLRSEHLRNINRPEDLS